MNFIRRWSSKEDVVRVIRLAGTIRAPRGRDRFGQSGTVSIQGIEKQIEQAFDCKKVKPKAVVLEVNSPGGSAVQSNLILTRVRNLATKNNVPVISFAEDVAASGGYWLALAGDEIFADTNSIIGSIGAISFYMGFEEAARKLGVESRPFVAGENKLRFNPFEPVKEKDAVWMNKLLSDIHTSFIDLVKARRKSLDLKHPTVFTGDCFTGTQALKIGLIDGIESDLNALIKKKYGEKVKIVRIEPPRTGLMSFFRSRTESVFDTHEFLDGVTDKLVYNKYGL